jgi:hypothetical protein
VTQRRALVVRITARLSHFRDRQQLGQLIDLIRLDLNDEASVSDYATRILAYRRRAIG